MWVNPASGKYTDFNGTSVRLINQKVELGIIELKEFSSTISGKLLSEGDRAIPGAEIWAWSLEGGWATATSRIDGSYSLTVAPGLWEVGYDLPIGSSFIAMAPKQVRIKENGQNKSLNFKNVREAKEKIKISIDTNDTNTDLSQVGAWVYTISLNGDQENEMETFDDVIAEFPYDEEEENIVRAGVGKYEVGLWLPPGSAYDLPDPKEIEAI